MKTIKLVRSAKPAKTDQPALALNKAIAAEKTGLESYLKFARSTKNESGKDMFIRLAQDEFVHMNILEKELDRTMAGQTWAKVKFEPSDIVDAVPHLSSPQAKVQAGEGTTDDLTALNIALDLERKAVSFYQREAAKAADAMARKVYAQLAEMEEAHFTMIQAEIDSIKDMGFWFGIKEFTLESNE